MGEEMNNISGGWFGPFIVPIIFFVLFFGIIGYLIGALLFSNDGEATIESFKKQAIENSCAQYNPSTGIFEWVKK